MTTLGRGGSDTTAVALAAALGADACEVYTDVRGVFTADPRLVETARKLDRVSYEEMLEMASSGAGVMMARSIEIARTHTVALHVRSSFEDREGTWITEEDDSLLEKALISAVVHQREETVYRVSRRSGCAALRRARRGERERRHDPPELGRDRVLGAARGQARRGALRSTASARSGSRATTSGRCR